MSEDNTEKLQSAIDAIRRGDRNTGRRLLDQIIHEDSENELAWMWMASCVNTMQEREECLERALSINPNNARAREALNRLRQQSGVRPTATRSEQPVERRRQRQQTPPSESSRGGLNILNLLIIVLGAFAVVAILFAVAQLTGDDEPPPTPTARPVVLATEPPPSPTPIPTRRRVINVTSSAPTLPPTFTPTATATPTEPPPPTETPIPLDEFVVFYTSLQEGAVQPHLFTVRGDGNFASEVGEGFDDIALDPTGERIAFVRMVDYPADADAGTEAFSAPELFIGTFGEFEDAQQVTELRSSVLSSPTWSPDGRELVFVSNFDGDEDLWYMTFDGENLRVLTLNTFIDRDPAWSPLLGSRKIVFASDIDSFGSTEIYTIDLPAPNEDPEYTRLTADNRSSYDPAWSTIGDKITFISDRSGDADVYVMNANGSSQRAITIDDNNSEDRAPVFTPDNLHITFISNRQDDRFQTYLVSLDGSVLTRLTTSEGNDTSVVYQPDLQLRLMQLEENNED